MNPDSTRISTIAAIAIAQKPMRSMAVRSLTAFTALAPALVKSGRRLLRGD